MYSSFGNHIFHVIHFIGALGFIYLVVPRLIFQLPKGSFIEKILASIANIVAVLIVLAYLLILIKLYEVLALLLLLLVFSLRKSFFSFYEEVREESTTKIAVIFYDWFDGLFSIRKIIRNQIANGKASIQKIRQFSLDHGIILFLLILILALSFYVRAVDMFLYPSPAMSDSYVTMSWMKNAGDQLLFVDGIYPQGFYMMLDYFRKFASIDPIYVLRYTGPMTNTLTVFIYYFFIYRLTSNPYAGLVAALCSGILGIYFNDGWSRQAATLSQEFSFFLILPTLYFFYRWVKENQRTDFRTGVMGASAIGLVHVIGYAYLWMGIGILLLVVLMFHKENCWERIFYTIKGFLISLGFSIMPMILGFILQKKFHENSINFAFVEVAVSLPKIKIIDIIALAASLVTLLSSIWGPKQFRLEERFIALFGFSAYFLYEFVGWITQKEMIATRAPDLWAFAIPLLIGIGCGVIFRLFQKLRPLRRAIPYVLPAIILIVAILYLPPPIYPDKLESDEGIEQYLRISNSYTPKSWMIVYSFREANNLIRGKGYHTYVGPKIGALDAPNFFLGKYDPTKPPLTKFNSRKPDLDLPPDIFIYYEKQVFINENLADPTFYASKSKEYETRENDMKELKKWLDAYEATHGELPIYYDGDTLTVYHLNRVESDE